MTFLVCLISEKLGDISVIQNSRARQFRILEFLDNLDRWVRNMRVLRSTSSPSLRYPHLTTNLVNKI
jgi:hypothetical protein